MYRQNSEKALLGGGGQLPPPPPWPPLATLVPERSYVSWNSNINVPHDIDWEKIPKENFNCTIDTRLRSFFFVSIS